MSSALVQLGQLLTGSEAAKLAVRFSDGDTLSQALQGISVSRRPEVRAALEAAGVVPNNLAISVPVLQALQGSGTRISHVSSVWTLPGYLADYGALTTSLKDLVLAARHSVMCSTFNFQKSSSLWGALREVASRGTVDVRVYMDAAAAAGPSAFSPSCEDLAIQLAGAKVFRTRSLNGKPVRNHAKFVAVDHQFIVVTSANFSMSAEQRNIELGVRLEQPSVVEMIEQQMLDLEPNVYELV